MVLVISPRILYQQLFKFSSGISSVHLIRLELLVVTVTVCRSITSATTLSATYWRLAILDKQEESSR